MWVLKVGREIWKGARNLIMKERSRLGDSLGFPKWH